ncbi:hypothetical protein HYU13_04155 [Candidatus Woesearchaeota archaeon]|nr:hypothetical protein [Candidatus Woesearchaeota archaeon]
MDEAMRKKADKSRGPRKGFVDFLSPYFSKGAMHQPILGKGYVDLIRFCPAEKFLAAFLSALIVMLPVASMSVFADTDGGIINPLVSDSKRVPGFVRGSLVPGGGTTFDLRATVKIPNDADLGCPNCQQFRITRPGAPAPEGFQSCTRVGATDYFDCLHILSTLEVGSNKVFSIAAELLTDAGAVFDTASFNGIIDEEAPVINSLSASPQLISTDDLQFTLSVKDTANAETISCSGMKYALFTYGATFSRTVDMVSNNCEVDTVISINAKDIIPLPPDPLSEDEGDIPIKVKVFDRLDQASAEATATFELDRVIPDIKPGTFRLLDSRGRDISYASSSQIPATAIIEISDKNIDLGSIKANFMSLKDANGAPAATGCTLAQGTAICRWEGLAVEIPQSIDPAAQIKDFVIQINASDFVLNNATFDLTYHIELDNTPPGVAEVKTGYKSQDVNYLGKKFNNITVVLAETGSGFASKDIFLDLTSINGTPHAAPNWCEKAGSFWECVWNDTQVTAIDGVQQISIEPDSADDVGNLITGELSHSIIVDKTDPVIGAASYAPTAPVSGDTIAFSFTAQDNALQLIALLQPLPLIPVPELKAYAETSSISTREGFQGACTGAYDCTVNANELFSAYTEAVINLTAKDPAGNTAKKEVPIIIYRGDPSGTPNFFTIGRIEPVPPSIDKKVASLTPLQLYFYTQLNKVGSQAQNDGVIVHNTLDCRESAGLINGDTATDPALLLQLGQRLPYYLMNEDSLEPIIAIESSNQIGTMESPLKFKCKMILQVRDATTVYANPEIEEVTVNVRLHGNGLGDLQDNINQKLEDINKDITDTEKDISSLEKWVNIFGIYCNIAQTIGTLSSALQLLKSALWPPLTVVYSACLACAICHCAGAIKALWTGICSITGKINWLADSFFWPTGFAEPFQIVGWILKISCMIFYYCALADWKTIASLVYSVVQDTRTTVAKFSGDIPIGTKTQEESTTKD